jgi:26S proteasome regulatory subunit N6
VAYGVTNELIIVRTLIDFFPPSARELQMKVTNENIEWARSEKRVFLRQSLEIKLIGQYVYLTTIKLVS